MLKVFHINIQDLVFQFKNHMYIKRFSSFNLFWTYID